MIVTPRPPRPPARLIVDDPHWMMPQPGSTAIPRRLRVWMFPDGRRIAVVTERGPGTSVTNLAGLVVAALQHRYPDDPAKLQILAHHPATSDNNERFYEYAGDDRDGFWHLVPIEQLIASCGEGLPDDMPPLPPDPFVEPET